MNHGVVMFRRGDAPESQISRMAMGKGQFVAVYAPKATERWEDESARRLWSSALAPAPGAPLEYRTARDRFGNRIEYARYEPAFDDQFLQICQRCSGAPHPTLVVPVTATDERAMRLVCAFDSTLDGVWRYLHERFYVVGRQELRMPDKSEIRLSTLMSSIHVTDG
jgi:hypothetical protein